MEGYIHVAQSQNTWPTEHKRVSACMLRLTPNQKLPTIVACAGQHADVTNIYGGNHRDGELLPFVSPPGDSPKTRSLLMLARME